MSAGLPFVLPEALPVLALVPAAWIAALLGERRRAARLRELAGPRADALAPELSRRRRRLAIALSGLGLLFALLAWLQPTWGTSTASIRPSGADLVLCLDVSRSMLARDVEPSRLAAAQREIRAFAGERRSDRVALVAFAGDARLLAPLTRDLESLAEIAELADPSSVARGGTDLGAALEAGIAALATSSGRAKALILVTDGEDLEQRGLRAAEGCRERGIAVHVLGIGTPRGSKIPVADESGGDATAFLRDRAGTEVISSLDEPSLRRIAETTGGSYLAAACQPRALLELYEEHVHPATRLSRDDDDADRARVNRFQWPLLLAVLLWLGALGLPGRRREGAR